MYTFHYTRWNFIHPFCFTLVKVKIHLGNQLYFSEADQGTQLSYIFQNICSNPSLNFFMLENPPLLKAK